MRYLILSLIVSAALLPGSQCAKKKEPTGCYKGRLEIEGICMNYTIKLLEGNMDTSMIESSWKDEHTGVVYERVFRLESVCSFPSGIKQGDEFYFTIDRTQKQSNCIVCMAHYPTPSKALSIAVSKTPCN